MSKCIDCNDNIVNCITNSQYSASKDHDEIISKVDDVHQNTINVLQNVEDVDSTLKRLEDVVGNLSSLMNTLKSDVSDISKYLTSFDVVMETEKEKEKGLVSWIIGS